jgi:4-hydroxy-3-methylbut-2-enyl diphosphate reductase
MEVKLCRITGFCSGVRAALDLTADMLKQHGPPVFILHELVHNESVVKDLLAKGAKIVDEPDGLPEGATLIFSAHGVSEDVEARARALPLNIVDATCPLVRQVQKRGAAMSGAGHTVLLFGKAGHREVEGILGRIHGEKHLLTSPDDARAFVPVPGRTYACISQTTMNSDAIAEMTSILREKIPGLVETASVCHATLTRQNAVRALAAECDLVLVAGSAHSSNTLRLCEIAAEQGARTELVPGPEAVTRDLLRGAKCVGVTSGASAPDALVHGIFDAVKRIAASMPEE